MKQARDFQAASAISAYVILNKKHQEIATIQAHHGNTCTVTVYNYGPNKSAEQNPCTTGTAGGWGYDKFTSALSGIEIDGHVMPDHCGRDPRTERLWKRYHKAAELGPVDQKTWDAKARKLGAHFANWDRDRQCYDSLFLDAGLDYLRTLGYRVLQAI